MSLVLSPGPGGFKTLQEEIAHYKAQYEGLEAELQEFQSSSKELEAELEKEVEASEKRERDLKKTVETLKYEVDEWRTKHKQSKADANAAQGNLQREITILRDSNRNFQLRLRDVEVANDDYERQARNTTSSLEDLESKYNMTIERGVMLEEEIKNGEQEREALRIETQRLKDELSDLKIEADITKEKLRASGVIHEDREKRLSQTSTSKTWESAVTSTSTPSSSSGPMPKSDSESAPSDAPTPPSPPSSDAPAPTKTVDIVTTPSKRFSIAQDLNATPKPAHYSLCRPRHARGPSILSNNGINTPSFARRPPRPNVLLHDGVPRAGSLYQIRGLIGKMQKLEERVQSARSKLPGPTNTPPRTSPRAMRANGVPATVTMRSNKRCINDATTDFLTPSRTTEEIAVQIRRRQSRPSFSGLQQFTDAPRPCSRASSTSRSGAPQLGRLDSRRSITGNMAMTDRYKQNGAIESGPPRSSVGGAFTPTHGTHPTQSPETADNTTHMLSLTARRTTLDKKESDTATSTPIALLRRQRSNRAVLSSASGISPAGRTRTKMTAAIDHGTECESKPSRRRQIADLGETF